MSALDRAAERPGGILGEARWPMASVVLAAMVLTYLLPEDLRLAPRWVLPLIEGLLLVAVVVGDPGQITRRSALLRGLSIGLVAVLVFDALLTTGLLIDDLLFWELDSGGAAARAHHLPRHPDLAFPQQLNPDLAPPGWRPRFIDYLGTRHGLGTPWTYQWPADQGPSTLTRTSPSPTRKTMASLGSVPGFPSRWTRPLGMRTKSPGPPSTLSVPPAPNSNRRRPSVWNT
jgi:hypothetical protein